MINSQNKGRKGEYELRDLLRMIFNCQVDRVPGSGSFKSLGVGGDMLPASLPPILKPYEIECKYEEAPKVFNYIRQCQAGHKIAEQDYLVLTKTDMNLTKWIIAYRCPAKMNIPNNFLAMLPAIELFGLLKELQDLREKVKEEIK